MNVTSYQQHRPLAESLSDRLRAGAYERCPSCLAWVSQKQTKLNCVYVPHDGRPPVAYPLCSKCARAVNGSPAEQRALTDRVELYLDGVRR